MDVPIARIDDGLELPAYARTGDAGLDLRAREEVVLAPGGGRALVPVGLVLALPEGMCGLVLPRSGLAVRHGVTVLNAPGLIDSGYRGEVAVPLINTDPTEPFVVRRGERIAQLLVVGFETVRWAECAVDDLLPPPGEEGTQRGAGGFGHSG